MAQPDDDQDDRCPHSSPERGEVGAHTAGESLQPQVQTPDVCQRHVLSSDVLQLQQIRVMEVEITHVAKHLSHIGDVPGWQQGQRIPIPPEVEHLTGQPHSVV